MLVLFDDAFSPYARKVNGFVDWFVAEMRAGRAFFPLPLRDGSGAPSRSGGS